MKTKILHPLWTHLPAVAALVYLAVAIITGPSLPTRAPVHFGFGGQPDRYGSPWQMLGLTLGLSVFFILLSVFLDELWARQERKKAFNWLSLFDEVTVGAMVGVSLGYLEYLTQAAGTFTSMWRYFLMYAGGAALLAVILELMRPFRSTERLPAGDNKAIDAELARRLKENTPFVYWDCQNPLYVTLLTTLLPVVMLVMAALALSDELWVSLLLAIIGIAFLIPYGGQRTLVTRQGVTVRFGILGIRTLQLRASDIARAETHEFSPLRDFGGYGLRFNREMKAYFLRGNRGVKLTTLAGKKYLVGSDNPESLAMIISAVAAAK